MRRINFILAIVAVLLSACNSDVVKVRGEVEGLKGKVKLAIVSQEYQLRELEMEKSQLKIILWIGSVSLILLLIVSMIAINLLRKKVRSEKKLRELEKKELEMKIFDEITKVDTKNRELSSSQLLSMAKNEKISDIIVNNYSDTRK